MKRKFLNTPKHLLLLDKAYSTMTLILCFTIFVFVSSITASYQLVKQSKYQSRVIAEKDKALKIVKQNNDEVKKLTLAYNGFTNEPINLLGGNPVGTGPKDGLNSKLILDALPSKYDYPALVSSIEKLLVEGGYRLENIGGSEGSLSQAGSDQTSSTGPIEMKINFTVNESYERVFKLLHEIESSIRPMHIDSISLSGSDQSIRANVSLTTYYQPQSVFTTSQKKVL
jgi:hypothetical protein